MLKKVLLVDDHFVVRTGVSMILEDNIDDLKVYTVRNYVEAIHFLKENDVNLIILDIDIPGGKKAKMVQEIRSIQQEVKILMFSAFEEEVYACRYIMAGANGYLNKQSEEHEIIQVVNSILNTGSYYTDNIVNKIVKASIDKKSINPLENLSKRELEVYMYLIKGEGNIEIANRLGLRVSTVSTYKKRIFEKLEVSNFTELISFSKVY
ncbi:response regulator transcription factor [Tamlana sp. 2201CG12-4]|uniref:response regulator transcription factor n=1 Tax=Tamlana sp. 2201CG12-4 TaxID=3112582 RepID=UPI002DB85997|nr:response regulator transcription factor [Tamlana sp. 2201CG12-4]MEC3908729.1 response regulator transcription factor [Tamlana sp. 2201CG12-4]